MNAKDATQVVDHFAKELSVQFHTLAPQALKIASDVKQIDSIGTVASSVLWLVLAGVAAILLLRYGIKRATAGKDTWDTTLSIIFGVISAIVGFVNLCVLTTDQWLWIGIVHPELAVYHDIIVKVMGT
jgi:hypothetical protein